MFKVIARYAPAVAVFGVLMSGSLAANAQRAEAAAQMPSVAVNYADLNLNTPAGVEALYARLRAASRSVCNVGQGRALADAMASKSCYREVLATSVGNANLPTLTARHRVGSAREG
jgi:UrcA family protein